MIKAMYAGTFFPMHEGHINVIERASRVFDKLIVVISKNEKKINKNGLDVLDKAFLQAKLEIKKLKLNNVEVLINKDLLTVDCAKKNKCHVLVRGIRNDVDLINEIEMAEINRKIGNIDTVFFSSEKKYVKISSSSLRKKIELQIKKSF